MNNAINLINRYINIGDKILIEDIAEMYYELTWRDLFEDNTHNLQDEGIVTLTLFNEILIDIRLEEIEDDYFIIRDIKQN